MTNQVFIDRHMFLMSKSSIFSVVGGLVAVVHSSLITLCKRPKIDEYKAKVFQLIDS